MSPATKEVAPQGGDGPRLPYTAVSAAIHQPLLVLAADLKVRYANPAFCAFFRMAAPQIEGWALSALASGPWDSPVLHQGLLDASSGRGTGVDQCLEWDHPRKGPRILRLWARSLNTGDGQLLLTVEDITADERARHELAARHEFAVKLIDSLREAVLVLTPQLRVHTANQPFYTLFRVTPAETLGASIYDLGSGQWAIPSLQRLLEEILPGARSFDDYMVEQTFPEVGWRRMSLNARRLDHESLILLTIRDLTESALGKQRLEDSEERFRLLVEATSQAVWETDAAGRVAADSPSWRAFTGQGREDWKDDEWLEMIHPDDRDNALAEWRSALAASQPLDAEYRFRGPTGEWCWSNVRASPLQDDRGRIRGWLGMNLDISVHKARETALRESETRFRAMADGLPLLIWVHDARARLEFVNRTYLDFFGVSTADVAGAGWRLVIHPDDAETYCDAFLSCHREQRPFHCETRVRDKAGEWRWLESWGRPRFSDDGGFLGMVGASADVTERRAMDQELRSTKAELEKRVAEEQSFREGVFDTASALIVTIDTAGRVVHFNRACEDMTGYDAARVTAGMAVMDLVPPRERQRVRRIHERVWAGEPRVGAEHGWCRRDGTCLPVSWNYTLSRSADGHPQYIIGTGVDFSEQRAVEEQARRHLEEAARLQRMHTVSQLTTVLAHELNQPLGAIAMFADSSRALLEHGPADQDPLRSNLERISKQAVRGGDIIRRLRSFMKQGRIDSQPVDINARVRNVCALLTGKADGFGISIDMELAADVPPLWGIPVHTEQVIFNLLNNAMEAIHDAAMESGRIEIETRRQGAMGRVSVHDSGPGIDGAAADGLFAPLASTKDYGLGVGLSVSRSLIEAQGGQLWVEPQRPGGVFHFTLPLAK